MAVQVEQEGDFGAANRIIDLVPDGGNCPVTSYNRREYVELYTKHLLTTSVAPQFNAFQAGFRKVCCLQDLFVSDASRCPSVCVALGRAASDIKPRFFTAAGPVSCSQN